MIARLKHQDLRSKTRDYGRNAMRGWNRAAVASLLAFACGLAATAARADDYPTRPVRLIVGFAPGAVADIIARAMAVRMSQSIGQQIVVENRPGAGSSLGAEHV